MSHYHLHQALARCRSTTLGCWTGIAPVTTSKTVLAQLLYHLNTAHINASVCRVGTMLVHHLQMLAQRRTRPAMLPVLWPVCNNYWPSRPAIGPQRWYNAGSTLLVRIINKTLAQHWVNAYNSFHLYINMLFFRLTSRINPSCQTDAVLITANKLKRDDSRAWFWQFLVDL